MSEQTAQEPTMEEILASIRRIISEDDAPAENQAAAPAEAAEAPAEPEPAAEEPSPALMDEPPSVQAESPAEEEVLELTDRVEEPSHVETVGDLDVAPAPQPQREPEPAFVAPTPQFQASAPVSASGGTTIEDLVRSILEPQIRAWADQNLDSIMRDAVRDALREKMDEKLERVFK